MSIYNPDYDSDVEYCQFCDGDGICPTCYGTGNDPDADEEDENCWECEGSGECFYCEGTGTVE